MADANLIVHAGGKIVGRDQVLAVPAPEGTDSWYPVAHGEMLQTVETLVRDAGMEIAKASYALSNYDQRFFGTLDLKSQIVDGVSLAIGIRNSNDKMFPMGMVAGTRVFVCDNLAFASNVYVAKRHTRFGRDRFDEGIRTAVAKLDTFRALEAKRINHYQQHEITETEAMAGLLAAYEKRIIASRNLDHAIAEWRNPSKEEFKPRTTWSLMNALTEVLKVQQKNAAKFTVNTMRLYGLMDSIAKYDVPTISA